MPSNARSESDAEAKRGVDDLSYAEAGIELDGIIEEFETGVVDVDRLVEQLERATDIVDELDRRLRRTRLQVEELVPRLEAIGRRDQSTSDSASDPDADATDETDTAAPPTDGNPGGLF
jgi:exodeoxyribonuclease VII small subunit